MLCDRTKIINETLISSTINSAKFYSKYLKILITKQFWQATMKYILLFTCLNVLISQNSFSEGNQQVFSLYKSFFNFLKKNGEYVLEISGGNTQCARDLKLMLSDFVYGKKWALDSEYIMFSFAFLRKGHSYNNKIF